MILNIQSPLLNSFINKIKIPLKGTLISLVTRRDCCRVFCKEEARLRLSGRILQSSKSVRSDIGHRRDSQCTWCYNYISYEYLRNGCDQRKSQSPGPKTEKSQRRLSMTLDGTWTSQHHKCFVGQITLIRGQASMKSLLGTWFFSWEEK